MYSILLNILFLNRVIFSFWRAVFIWEYSVSPVAFLLPIVLLHIIILMTMIVKSSFSIPLYSQW